MLAFQWRSRNRWNTVHLSSKSQPTSGLLLVRFQAIARKLFMLIELVSINHSRAVGQYNQTPLIENVAIAGGIFKEFLPPFRRDLHHHHRILVVVKGVWLDSPLAPITTPWRCFVQYVCPSKEIPLGLFVKFVEFFNVRTGSRLIRTVHVFECLGS